MADRFDYFVILAEMRTGSNFLEATVNSYPGLKCWGEAYNPAFVGKANTDQMCGISKAQRERHPEALLQAMISQTEGLAGFRFFHNHDPRMLDRFMDDPKCAKIILTRNPLESYVSKKIADQTGQWRLGDLKDAKTAKISFEKSEFETMLDAIKAFQIELQRRLQTTGQTAFYINYEDIKDIEVVNGLARFLGVDVERHATSQKTKVQNPSQLKDKVHNYDQMVAALSGIDHFNLANTPNFEPRRGPTVPGYVAAAQAPLLYLPVRSGPERVVRDWLAALDGVDSSELTVALPKRRCANGNAAPRSTAASLWFRTPSRGFTVRFAPISCQRVNRATARFERCCKAPMGCLCQRGAARIRKTNTGPRFSNSLIL